MAITIEDLQDPENAEALNKLLTDLGYKKKEEIEGLQKNRDVVLKEKKKLQLQFENAEAEKKELEERLAELEDIKAERDRELVDTTSGKFDDVEISKVIEKRIAAEQKKYDRELEKYKKNNENLISTLDKFKQKHYNDFVTRKVETALDKIDVHPVHKSLLTEHLVRKAKWDVSEDNLDVSSIHITDDSGIPMDLSDYLKNFSQSDEFKYYRKQPDNTGGGAIPAKSNEQGKNSTSLCGSLIPPGTFKGQ